MKGVASLQGLIDAMVHVPHHSRNHVQEAATIETGERRCEIVGVVLYVHLCLHNHYAQAESYVLFLLVAGILHKSVMGKKRKSIALKNSVGIILSRKESDDAGELTTYEIVPPKA